MTSGWTRRALDRVNQRHDSAQVGEPVETESTIARQIPTKPDMAGPWTVEP